MDLEKKEERLESLYEKLKALRPLKILNKAEEKRLLDDFTTEMVYNTSAIEGNTFTLKETYILLKDKVTVGGKTIKDHLEIINLKESFDYVLDLAKSKEQLTVKDIKDLHYLVLNHDKDNRGSYRSLNVRVGEFVPVDSFLVGEKLEDLVENYHKSDLPLIKKLAKFHLDFESIHPFIDGNGRTGRLLINLELIKEGYLPIDIKFKNRDLYYGSFDLYHENKDLKPMYDIFISYEISELENYLKQIENKQKSLKRD